MFNKVVLLSTSEIKLGALRNTVESNSTLFVENFELVGVKPGETLYPQPIGKRGAFAAIQQRLEPFLKEIAKEENAKTLYVVIENYVDTDEGGTLHDRVAISITANCGRWIFDEAPDGFGVSIPVPEDAAVWLSEQNKTALGCAKTVGQFLHEKYPECPSNDWFKFARGPCCISRQTQIERTFYVAFAMLKQKQEMQNQVKTYKFKGVSFKDIFPLLSRPTIVAQHAKSLISSRLRGNEAWINKKVFVAGLESRGLLLAAMIATALDVGFVALRKPGKLAFDETSPLVSKEYMKEYGTDCIEVQPEHLKPFKNGYGCVLVDDILATGGSIEAAAAVLTQCNVKIEAILVLDDILPIRSVWQKKFAENAVLKDVPVLCIL